MEIWGNILKERFTEFTIDMGGIKSEVFINRRIGRELDPDFMVALCDSIQRANMGCWLSSERSTGQFLLYKRPLSEWVGLIHGWAIRFGKINSIESAYSLIHGDDTRGELFHSIPDSLALKALQEMEAIGKCELVFLTPDNRIDITTCGVKFFH